MEGELPALVKLKEEYFGFTAFCPGQLEASVSALHGRMSLYRFRKEQCMFIGPLSWNKEATGMVLNGLMQQVREVTTIK